jgi:hypothetical protein
MSRRARDGRGGEQSAGFGLNGKGNLEGEVASTVERSGEALHAGQRRASVGRAQERAGGSATLLAAQQRRRGDAAVEAGGEPSVHIPVLAADAASSRSQP